MDGPWIFLDDDSESSCYSPTDSDKIDSETEAELYSKIHYDDNISCINSENLNEKPSELLIGSPFKVFFTNKEENVSSVIKSTSEHPFINQVTCENFSSEKRKSCEMDADCKNSEKNLSPVKKHKPNSLRNFSVVSESNNSENTNLNSSLQFNINNQNKKNDTVLLDSSDSDSNFWIEPSFAEKSDLKINLLKDTETIFLNSSDSDNESDVSPSFVKRDSILKNLSMPNIKTDGNSKGLWHINYEDLHRSKKYSYRYHDNVDITCSNCNRRGHTLRTCPSPRVIKCFLCGGNHIGSRCSNRMCSNCYISGHDRKNCWKKIKKVFCHLCHMEGHAKVDCPDLWRRYHLTTKPFKIRKGKQVQQDIDLYCWNCGRNGHFGGVCPLLYLSRSSFSTWPCVICYDNPKTLLKEKLSLLRKIPCSNTTKQNNHLNNISSTSEEKDVHLKLRNKLNISSGSNEENSKRRKKKLKETGLRFSKIQDIGSDFPRTPKKKSPIKCPNNFDKLEVIPELLVKKQLNKLRKQWIKQERKRASLQSGESQQVVTQNDVSKIHFEDDLPESVKLQAEKRFKKWQKNRMNRLRKRKQSISKGRELTKSS